MQGTVKTYDPETRSGVLLSDDGAEVTFDAAAMKGSALRLLRIGQRLDFRTGENGEQAAAGSLKIPTF
jgi:cold shock CspA family protein